MKMNKNWKYVQLDVLRIEVVVVQLLLFSVLNFNVGLRRRGITWQDMPVK